MVLYHIKESADQFIIFHRQNTVNVLLGVWEDGFSYALHCSSVCDRVGAIQRHRPPGLDGRRHAGCRCRLHADHLDLWIQHLCQGGYAGYKSAAADWHQYVIHRRKLLHDLHSDGSLAGRDIQVVKRMHECIAVLLCQLDCMRAGIIIDIAMKHDICPVTLSTVYFNQRRDRRHDDGRLASKLLGSVCHALGMVACGCGNQALLPFFLAHRADLVICAAHLVCSGILHILWLQVYFSAGLAA